MSGGKMMAAALAYAGLGWPVFPVKPRGKLPLTRRGLHDASTEAAQIRAWWEQWPDANIGVAVGKAGLWVLDVDVDADKGTDGFASLAALEAEFGRLPETVTQRTPRGGLHLLFRHPGVKVKGTAGKIGAGLDSRGDGGYIVVAPSVHPNGGAYRWDEDAHPLRAAAAEAPDWLTARVVEAPKPAPGAAPPAPATTPEGLEHPYLRKAFEDELAGLRGAREGGRNDALNRAAFALGTLVGGGHLARATVEAALLASALAVGLDAKEAEKTLASGLEAGMAAPRRELPDRAPPKRRKAAAKAGKAGGERIDPETGEVLADGAGEGEAGESAAEAPPPPRGRRKGKGGGDTPPDSLAGKVARINRDHALVLVGGKALVLREAEGESGYVEAIFQKPADFKLWHANERVVVHDANMGVGDAWLIHPERRQYRGVTFQPQGWGRPEGGGEPAARLEVPENFYNLWRGYACAPAPFYADPERHLRHFPTFADHMLTNVMRGNRDWARWLWGWAAHLIQRPGERLGVTPVLRGRQGSGKSKPGEVFGSLIPQHYVQVDNPRYLVGQFNAHMANCLLLQADEGFWAGDKTAEGQLKGMVTSREHLIEPKGIDPIKVRNFIHLWITSNTSWVVPAAFEERRFAVFDVGDAAMQNAEYFAQIDKEMDEGGREHLLAYLIAFDLGSVNLRDIPATEALFEQKVSSLDTVQAWWFHKLDEGRVFPSQRRWETVVRANGLYADYVAYADRLGVARKKTEEQLAGELKKLLPGERLERTRPRVPVYGPQGEELHDSNGNRLVERQRCYVLPELAACREQFCELVRWTVDWADDEAEGGGDGGGGGEGEARAAE